MDTKHAFFAACLRIGVVVGKPSNVDECLRLVHRLHPRTTEHPLIRLGGVGDGGYLVPDDLTGIAACFSPGVADCASFEQDAISRGIPCYLADASVNQAPISGDRVHFIPKFIDVLNSDMTMTLDDWVKCNAPNSGDLLLQMDIEGAEWRVLLNVSDETLRRFRILTIEFHSLERLMDKHSFLIIKAVFDRLLRDFLVVHSHPNNSGGKISAGSFQIPRVLEMTFLRKDRVQNSGYITSFPHPLDVINEKTMPDIPLPPQWFHSNA
jgi:hypothetical protein